MTRSARVQVPEQIVPLNEGDVMTNSSWSILDQAHEALRAAVDGVGEDQWGAPTPCENWTVAQVLQHALGDQQAYGAVLTGAGFPDFDPFAPTGEFATDPRSALETALSATADAYRSVAPDAAEVAVPLPQGPLPATVAAGAAALDAAVHAWDIAVATGQRPLLDDELATQLLPIAPQVVEPVRAFAFAPALGTDGSDSPTTQLLKYVGRDPSWS
jgi:uncharacterized protein (TIGR03086 family)